MKKFLLGTVGLVALGMVSPASAADLAARPYTKAAPMMVAMYDWSGFYVGANAGYGSSRKCYDDAGFVGFPLPVPIHDACGDSTGGLVGGQIGYNWQAGSWAFGLEAQGDWADLSWSVASTLFPATSARARIDGIGLFTGRVGYAWNNVLLYVKGGAAVASDRYNAYVTATNLDFATGSETRWGGVVGAGLEYGFAPNWSVGFEYDHMFMGANNVTLTAPLVIPALYPVEHIGQDVDMATVRVNYRWGGPVVARY